MPLVNLRRDVVLRANQSVHTQLATSNQYNKSPHFLPENQKKVRGILEGLVRRVSCDHETHLIDFGCGTGFIIHLASDLVDKIDGVDITREMMNQVDLSAGNITLTQCEAEETPFPDETFDIATAYSFLDHLLDYRTLLKEAYRVLKPGGIFYADLNPNRRFIKGLAMLDENEIASEVIRKEIHGSLHNGEYYQKNFDVDQEVLSNAEPGKSLLQGFEESEVKSDALKTGFSECEVHYDWFFAQGVVMHNQSFQLADEIDSYLRSLLPVTSNMFKYLRFILKK